VRLLHYQSSRSAISRFCKSVTERLSWLTTSWIYNSLKLCLTLASLRLSTLDWLQSYQTVSVTSGTPADPACWVAILELFSDRVSLGRVLTELLNNAYKYTPASGEIVLKVGVGGEPRAEVSTGSPLKSGDPPAAALLRWATGRSGVRVRKTILLPRTERTLCYLYYQ